MKKNLLCSFVAIFLLFTTEYLQASGFGPGIGGSGKATPGPAKPPKPKSAAKTMAEKANIVAKQKLVNQQIIAHKQGSAISASSQKSTITVTEGLTLGENASSQGSHTAKSTPLSTGEGLNLSSLSSFSAPAKPVKPSRSAKPPKKPDQSTKPKAKSTESTESSSLDFNGLESTAAPAKPARKKVEQQSEASTKITEKRELDAKGKPTEKTIFETRNQKGELLSKKIVEKDGKSFSEYLGESTTPFQTISYLRIQPTIFHIKLFNQNGRQTSHIVKNQKDGKIVRKTDFDLNNKLTIETNFKDNRPSERITKTESGEIKGKEVFAENGTYQSINPENNTVMETGTYTLETNGNITMKPHESGSQSPINYSSPAKIAEAYATLGVSAEATPKEVQKAYKKLALKNHPDKGGNAAEFRKIGEAHELLNEKFESNAPEYNMES